MAAIKSTSSKDAEFIKVFNSFGSEFTPYQLFSIFIEMFALSISNSFEPRPIVHDQREKRYSELMKNFNENEFKKISQLAAEYTKIAECGLDDNIGRLFHVLNMSNSKTGQFFTPFSLSQICAESLPIDKVKEEIKKKGYISVNDPACGASGMGVAAAKHLLDNDINPQQCMYFEGTDIDLRCILMSYVQLSLYGIPALLIHGNGLSLEVYDIYITPALWMNIKMTNEQVYDHYLFDVKSLAITGKKAERNG